ncbi:hypothetical protein M3Y98_00306200 [Aphelenchoides besseyi]|nr:hypothetical protein M3Y98_00306200 [Aphelenchoides besseyi]KAI6201275.1 hypothetical protein M3Y96_00824400 [Aphelenchoides besseyi]
MSRNKNVEGEDTGQIINMETYQTYLWQRRLLAVVTALNVIGIGIFIGALFHPTWSVLDFVNNELEHINVKLGVWGEYRSVNTTGKVEFIPHFPAPPEKLLRLADEDLKHYYRVQAAFGVISLAFMICTNVFAIYTFTHHRYMYKRLVAMLHAVTAGCVVVVMEVLTSSINEWNVAVVNNARRHADFAFSTDYKLGPGYYLAGSVVLIYAFACIVFFVSSHKQKGNRAATTLLEFEDRPLHLSRH